MSCYDDLRRQSDDRACNTTGSVTADVQDVYALGFGEFLAGLIVAKSGYELVESARTGPDRVDARFTVRNAVGERFTVGIEHVGREHG